VIEENNGYDVIFDFNAAAVDQIQIQIQANANGTEIATFAEILAKATTVDGNTEINLGGDYIRLVGVQAEHSASGSSISPIVRPRPITARGCG
jgi:hypothetical protein